MIPMKSIALILFLLAMVRTGVGAEPRPMKVTDLFRFKRVSDPQVSPDGKWVVYSVTDVDLEKNSTSAKLWIVSTEGGEPKLLTNSEKKDLNPRWSPDSKTVVFLSNRSENMQLWAININGGEAKQLTNISTGASTPVWSPDGKHLAFVSAVYPEYSRKSFKESDKLNKERDEEKEKSPVKAKVFTKLFYRHWDSYVEDKRQHIFVISYEDGKAGEPKDVTPGDRDAYPTSMTFSVGDDFTFSPDGKYLVYTATPTKNEAWSTNFDLCRVPITGGKIETLTTDNKAADSGPQFSPDGSMLAYRAQEKAGYEADRWQLMIAKCNADGSLKSEPKSVTPDFDYGVDGFLWNADNETITLNIDYQGEYKLFEVSVKSGKVKPLKSKAINKLYGMLYSLSRSDDGSVVAMQNAALSHPPEVVIYHPKTGKTRQLETNQAILDEIDMPRPETVNIDVEGPTDMQMWILKPPGFDAKKKWPLIYLVHGGPQGAWHDGWSYRWNPEAWAAQGYVVALPNPRGSTGFGQKFVEEISGDWGGKCFDDLMAGMDYLEKQPYIDTKRMASAGASFGGYMMNYFQGKTDRFKTLVTHCGVYNFESMYMTTEELWFDEWEHGGPPWGKNRESYEKHSPHKYAKNFKTPMLIIHNDLDFRVPVSEGHQLFTTLQRLGVPSKFINFPDEGHWVLKPKNSEYWHNEVFAWLKKYVKPGGK